MDIEKDLFFMIIMIGCCVVLPIMIVWLLQRSKLKSEQNRKDFILAALDKNADINIENLVRQMNKPNKLLKEKLLRKLQWGLMLTFIGLALIVAGIIKNGGDDFVTFLLMGGSVVGIGASFLISYSSARNCLSKRWKQRRKICSKTNLI